MSLATNLTSVLMGRHYDDALSLPVVGKLSPSQFCYLLEKAVEYMQDPTVDDGSSLAVIFRSSEFLAAVWSSIRAGHVYMISCVVVLIYDYIITLDREVNLIWSRKQCNVAFLFYCNRYLPLATYIFVICGVFASSTTPEFCTQTFPVVPAVMIVLSEATIGTLRITKIRALWRNELNHFLLWAIVGVFMLQTSLAIACATAVEGVGPLFGPVGNVGCFIMFRMGSMPRLVLYWFANVTFNVLIFLSILRKAISVRRLGGARRLADVLLRDAVMFLVVLSAVKIVNLVMLVVFPYWNAINWSFNHIADVILTSRLLFNLREATDIPPPSDAFALDEDSQVTGISYEGLLKFDPAFQPSISKIEASGMKSAMEPPTIYIGVGRGH